MTKTVLSKYAPVALGVFSGGVAVLCLWVGATLLAVPRAGLVAFACISGSLFWASGVGAALMFWLDQRDREEFAARREELRRQLKGGPRRTA